MEIVTHPGGIMSLRPCAREKTRTLSGNAGDFNSDFLEKTVPNVKISTSGKHTVSYCNATGRGITITIERIADDTKTTGNDLPNYHADKNGGNEFPSPEIKYTTGSKLSGCFAPDSNHGHQLKSMYNESGPRKLTKPPPDYTATVVAMCIICPLAAIPLLWYCRQSKKAADRQDYNLAWEYSHISLYILTAGMVCAGVFLVSITFWMWTRNHVKAGGEAVITEVVGNFEVCEPHECMDAIIRYERNIYPEGGFRVTSEKELKGELLWGYGRNVM